MMSFNITSNVICIFNIAKDKRFFISDFAQFFIYLLFRIDKVEQVLVFSLFFM